MKNPKNVNKVLRKPTKKLHEWRAEISDLKYQLERLGIDNKELSDGTTKKIERINHYKTLVGVLNSKIEYWKSEAMDAKTAHINLMAGVDNGIQPVEKPGKIDGGLPKEGK